LNSLKPHQIGAILAASGSLLVSLDSLGFRLTEEPPWNNAFWVGSFIALAMLVTVPIKTGKSLVAVARSDGPTVLLSGSLQAVSTSFFILALDATAVSNVVAIVAAVPMLSALIAHYAIKEATPLRTWLAILAAVCGILIIVSGSLGAGTVRGDLYAVIAITGFSINLVIWRKFPALNREAIIGIGGALVAVVAYVPANPFEVSTSAILILAVLGILTGPAGRVSIATATRYLPAAQVGLFTPVETVAATTWAWLFLSETPPTATIIGGLIVIAAVGFGVTTREKSEVITPTPG
jgi:drug/metabolite transporter (DMT)-like permease